MADLKRDVHNVAKRAHRALDIAARMAQVIDKEQAGHWVSSRIDEIHLNHEGYAEPGYSSASGIVAVGNWNKIDRYDRYTNERKIISDLPSRLFDIFETLGIEGEWSDQWSECSGCYKLVRTSGDSWSWQPSYWCNDSELLCHECVKEDPESYLLEHEGNPRTCITIESIDPAEHGYRKLNDDAYETGWHKGQNDDPKTVAADLLKQGITRFLFRKDEQSQFYSRWSVYVYEGTAEEQEENRHEEAIRKHGR